MGIDSIGTTGFSTGLSPIGASSTDGALRMESGLGVDSATVPDKFSLTRAKKTDITAETSPLDRLRAGEINLDGYLDARVNQATAHLVNRIDHDQLEFIRSSLRTQLEQDPGLADLVRRATGLTHNALHGR